MAINVLVVDDSAVVRSMILLTLRVCGIDMGEAYQAANGQLGLDELSQHWIDLVFVDINMPVMNGEEMVNRVRENPLWADLPIVVVSTEGSETRIERLLQKGAYFVHKPFAPEAVREILNKIMGVPNESN
jgi:two-component system chemotaxis response regulator CheY